MKTRVGKQLSRALMIAAVAVLSAAAPSGAVAAPQSQNATAGAGQQSNQPSDITITRNIRRAVVKDKTLSTAAHNVTIITKDGKVTLKGKVKSDAEKQTVEAAAANVAGQGNVDDQLTTSAIQ
jgi:hyperosmotically inducible periplasmic protein